MQRHRLVQIEVEENANRGRSPLHVFPMVGRRRPLFQLLVRDPKGEDKAHVVTGWSSVGGDTPCAAYCVPVEDAGSSETVLSFLVYGGDLGLRFKAAGLSEGWAIGGPNQFGEPCLLLAIDPVTEWLDRHLSSGWQ